MSSITRMQVVYTVTLAFFLLNAKIPAGTNQAQVSINCADAYEGSPILWGHTLVPRRVVPPPELYPLIEQTFGRPKVIRCKGHRTT
jgi:hypothetical protein